MEARGRIESDGTAGGTRVWLAEVEVTEAVHRIEWAVTAQDIHTASVSVSFFADMAIELNGLKLNDPAPLFTEVTENAPASPDYQ